ncbi:MAG TPA: NADP-dependent oxidoreductase [Xanthobacteraceae bacterium]|nr:NADP-dependent oxidoreductase [Xanthobacteraceae bacterium]
MQPQVHRTQSRPNQAAARGRHTMQIPHTMEAAAIDHFGPPEVLVLHVVPVPAIDADEVLIALDTAGVGPWDANIREGWYPDGKPQFPLVLGVDGAGTVAAVGSRVHRLKVGDKVYAYRWMNRKGGFYAEYVSVAAENVARIPKRLGLEEAGAIPTTGLTALQGIDDALHVKKGESVIIHGGSGGVGTLAIQFAKRRGARVLATGSGLEGVELVREMGADVAIDGKHDDIEEAARRFASDGVDAILALAGGDALERAVDALKPNGRLAYPNGIEPEPKKRRGMKVFPYDAIAGVREFQRLNRAVEAAKLKVPIAEAFGLVDAAKAHRRLAEGHILGKIVLRTHRS